jgi:hypothetical protein
LAEQALPHAAIHAEKFGAVTVLLMALGSLPEPSMAGRRIVRSAKEASAQLAQTCLEDIAASLRAREPPNWAWLDAMAYEGTPSEMPEPAEAEQKPGFFIAHLPRIGSGATLPVN